MNVGVSLCADPFCNPQEGFDSLVLAPKNQSRRLNDMKYVIYCRRSSEAEDRQVLSIASQQSELRRVFGMRDDIEITRIFEESKSAMSPGRPIFREMMDMVDRGEADGIIAWAPDRLARNSIDGGALIYALDRGVLRDLKFATYTFENNPQGKFMLQIMFGQSKYYSDALSENVKRGNRTKLEQGWRPNQAPLGYLNDLSTKTIVADPIHFPLVRRIFDLVLSGDRSPRQVALIARDEWGFRTPKRRKTGGTPLAMSSLYKMLSNPFYAGLVLWNGQVYQGKHTPIISIDEWKAVQTKLKQRGAARPKTYEFAYTGWMRCGSCGRMITAEHKRNRFGSTYVYYHCSKRTVGPRCQEPSIELRNLECQLLAFVESVSLHPLFEGWLHNALAEQGALIEKQEQARRASLDRAITAVDAQLSELTGLRVRALLSDEEFLERRVALQLERSRLEASVDTETRLGRLEPLQSTISLSRYAAELFQTDDVRAKRQLLETLGSNPVLSAGKVSIQAAKPFVELSKMRTSPRLLADIEDVRMRGGVPSPALRLRAKRVIARLQRAFDDDPDRDKRIRNLQALQEKCRLLTDVSRTRRYIANN